MKQTFDVVVAGAMVVLSLSGLTSWSRQHCRLHCLTRWVDNVSICHRDYISSTISTRVHNRIFSAIVKSKGPKVLTVSVDNNVIINISPASISV
eukprot:45547-Prorocentrum_minimum.AAC.4